ncbi:unnamed protein product [Calypogeia fissa]
MGNGGDGKRMAGLGERAGLQKGDGETVVVWFIGERSDGGDGCGMFMNQHNLIAKLNVIDVSSAMLRKYRKNGELDRWERMCARRGSLADTGWAKGARGIAEVLRIENGRE